METYCKYIRHLLLLVVTSCTLTACENEECFSSLSEEGEKTIVTVCPTILRNSYTRAVGDATKINELVVAVYEDNDGTPGEQIFRSEYEWEKASKEGVALSLVDGRSYHLLFWAQCSDNKGYVITNEGNVEADYSEYQTGGFSRMEELDAFYGTKTITVEKNQEQSITLTRPLAQLNFADNITAPQSTTHKAKVTFHGIPISFNPFTGKVESSTKDVTFTFTDFTDEPLVVNGENYFYVTSNYLFAPSTGTSKVSVTLKMLKADDGSVIKELSFTEEGKRIALSQNMKTNVLGSIVQEPETWSVWDGVIPTTSPIKRDEQNRYIIDEAADLAWLSVNGATLDATSTFLQTKDIDMASKAIASIKLPAGSTYDGGGKQIINYANSLFGDATNLSVQHLTVDKVTVPQSDVTHVGVLINTLTGSATFNNVTVSNSTATTTNGAAGGFVGYIKNKDTETLAVSLTQCTATNNTVSGSLTTGVYVGLFRGYNNAETLTFSNDCNESSASVGQDAVASYYTTANAACWFTDTQKTGFNKYSGWLGREEFYRGTINYGDVRYIPKWDGVTSNITPLTDGSTKLIYSAFDLANLQNASGVMVTFKSNVDMGAYVFDPIMTATKLQGKTDSNDNYVIYNLKINTEFLSGPWYGGAFIRKMTSGSVENITIKNANVNVKNAEGGEDAYASILVATIEGSSTVTVKNVKIDGGYLKGINKIGGIAGYVSCNLQATNCIVNGLTIENFTTSNTGDVFESYGEIGGLIGLIQGNGSVISQCQVNNSTLNVKSSTLRYNNRFIGTANPSSGQKITIQTNCSATNNSVTNEDKLTYGFFKTFNLLGGYSLSVLQGGAVYYGNTKLK